MYIACKYCDKFGVFENECDCSSPEVRAKIDEYHERTNFLEIKLEEVNEACYKLLKDGIPIDIVKKLWEAHNTNSKYLFEKWHNSHYRDIKIIADISELFNKRKCMSIHENGKYRRFTHYEILKMILEDLELGSSEKEKLDWPKMSVDELVDKLIEEKKCIKEIV